MNIKKDRQHIEKHGLDHFISSMASDIESIEKRVYLAKILSFVQEAQQICIVNDLKSLKIEATEEEDRCVLYSSFTTKEGIFKRDIRINLGKKDYSDEEMDLMDFFQHQFKKINPLIKFCGESITSSVNVDVDSNFKKNLLKVMLSKDILVSYEVFKLEEMLPSINGQDNKNKI